MSGLATVEEALEALRSGRPVLVLDDEGRENEGDLVLAAETATEEWMAWTVRHSSSSTSTGRPLRSASRACSTVASPLIGAPPPGPRAAARRTSL